MVPGFFCYRCPRLLSVTELPFSFNPDKERSVRTNRTSGLKMELNFELTKANL